MTKPKLRLTFNIIIGILALTYIGLVIFSILLIIFGLWLFIHRYGFAYFESNFAPKKNRSDEYRNY